MARKISDERKVAYYLGGLLMALGLLSILSVFVTGCMNFGDFSSFESDAKSAMARGLTGMALLFVGGLVRGVGSRGLAGSGVLLDPEQAREDLEPFSRQAGGMLGDGLDEAGIDLGRGEAAPRERVVVRCTGCRTLNDEDARFCKGCGAAMGG